jgi:hypothetical protein
METNAKKELLRATARLFTRVFLIVIPILLGAALIIRIVGSNPLEIRDWYDLDDIRNNLDGKYILMNNLGSSTDGYEELASETANQGKGWQPIGTRDHPFSGIFDGQGLQIRDLFINRPDERYVGLFHSQNAGCTIKNVGLVKALVVGRGYVGGLLGENRGDVSNSYFVGNLSGEYDVGGLVGFNDFGATVTNSYSTGTVTGNDSVGGLVGNNDGYVSYSYSAGDVTGNEGVGGLVGSKGCNGYVNYSFWDAQTSRQAVSNGGTGRTTAKMRDITNYLEAGWNITAVDFG